MLRKINPAGVPGSPAYSHAVEATGMQRILFISGQVGMKADGSIADGIAEQTRTAIANLGAVLAEGGMTANDVVKFTIYLTDEKLLPDFMATAGGMLPMPAPASTLLFVKALAAPSMLVEIEAIAVK